MFTGLADPAVWVAVAFFGFVGILLWKKIPAAIASALDDRADQIRSELDEAKKLREDAQIVLADYQRKQREAETEAEEIIKQAQKEAEILASETEQKLAEQLERRTRQAEEKIARAEQQAISDVQRTAAQLSITAAENILRNNGSGDNSDRLIKETLKAIPENFS
ncbi:MAG: F0F1 ATP synthase subunit B [Hyphomicrobiaceae bacterium]|nr:F0F1 ATP synthase subunit B [Hyphomicrobiaceae bacterium]